MKCLSSKCWIDPLIKNLYSTFYHKISGDSMRMWIGQVHEFRSAIWEKLQEGIVDERDRNGRNVEWEIIYPANTFRIFGWLDDTDMQTTRPRPARVGEAGSADARDTQQAFYK